MAEPPDHTSHHLRRAIDGNPEDLDWIVRRFTPVLLAKADVALSGRLKASYASEDVAQEVWARVIPKLPEIHDRDGRFTPSFVKYLTSTLTRYVNRLHRDAVRAARATDDGDRVLQGLSPETRGIVTRALFNEQIRAAGEALASLGEDDRRIIVLRLLDQLGNTAAAAYLGIEPNACAVRFHRALKRLRELLPNSVFDELAGG